jgi:hypothetical protein
MKLTPQLIEKLDSLAPSPTDLASLVYNILKAEHQDLDNYTLAAFCVEFLAAQSMSDLPFLGATIVPLAKDFYYSHYLRVMESCQTSESELIKKEDGISTGLPDPSKTDSSLTTS